MPYHHIDITRQDGLEDVEVYHDEDVEEPGWYYAYGSPGYLWDSAPSGPYETEEDALTEAREAAGYCAHGYSPDMNCEVCDDG